MSALSSTFVHVRCTIGRAAATASIRVVARRAALQREGRGVRASLLSHRMCTIRADGGASLRYFVYRTPLHHLHLLRPRARHALAAEGSTRGATALFFFLPPTIPLEHLIFCLPSVHPSACVVISCVWVSSRVS